MGFSFDPDKYKVLKAREVTDKLVLELYSYDGNAPKVAIRKKAVIKGQVKTLALKGGMLPADAAKVAEAIKMIVQDLQEGEAA